MSYSKLVTVSTLSAIETVAKASLAALDAGVTTCQYADIAWAHYHEAFLGDAATERYEAIGYTLGTGLVIVFAIVLNGLDQLQGWVDQLQGWVDQTVEDAQSAPAEFEPIADVAIPVRKVFFRLIRSLIYDIFAPVQPIVEFVGDVVGLLTHFIRRGFTTSVY